MNDRKRRTAKISLKEPEILKAAAESDNTAIEAEVKKSGRLKLPESEKLSKRVTLMLKESEYERFEAKAGGIPLGLFLRTQLKSSTDLID